MTKRNIKSKSGLQSTKSINEMGVIKESDTAKKTEKTRPN